MRSSSLAKQTGQAAMLGEDGLDVPSSVDGPKELRTPRQEVERRDVADELVGSRLPREPLGHERSRPSGQPNERVESAKPLGVGDVRLRAFLDSARMLGERRNKRQRTRHRAANRSRSERAFIQPRGAEDLERPAGCLALR